MIKAAVDAQVLVSAMTILKLCSRCWFHIHGSIRSACQFICQYRLCRSVMPFIGDQTQIDGIAIWQGPEWTARSRKMLEPPMAGALHFILNSVQSV